MVENIQGRKTSKLFGPDLAVLNLWHGVPAKINGRLGEIAWAPFKPKKNTQLNFDFWLNFIFCKIENQNI